MDATLLPPSSPDWTRALESLRHDFYHLPSYTELAAWQEGGRPTAFLARDSGRVFLAPLILRAIPESALEDATVAYGYPTPLCSHEAFVCSAVEALVAELQARRVVSAFFRLHPLLPLSRGPLAAVGRLLQHGETVSIDLTLPDEEIRRRMRRSHRYEIDRAREDGTVVERDTEWREFDAFEAAYRETMRRQGAADQYLFSHEYFERLRTALGDRLSLFVARIGGRVASAALFTESCGIVQYHLSGTLDDFVPQRPSKLILDTVRSWAKQRGHSRFHLGGGLGGRADSLFQFKAGFSPDRHSFLTWRVVAAQGLFDDLCAAWSRNHGIPADSADGFFPPYRKSGA